MKTDITRKDEEKFLKLKVAQNKIFEKSLSFAELISAIQDGSLPLEVSDDDGTKIIDDSSFEEIKKVVPCLMKIVDKPRSFIRTIEEKTPVETAKRINHKAIAKLSQDSNDWYARTLFAVKPKNIVSDINEETIDLYENRFICALIDRVGKLLAQARRFYQDQIKSLDDDLAVEAINREYQYSTRSFMFYNKIVRNSLFSFEDLEYRKKIEKELVSIKSVEKKVRYLKRTDFYRSLHKKKKVVDPIQKTNILMFEFNYNKAYKLWVYLNKNNKEEKLDLDVQFEAGELNVYYNLYCFLCVLSALHDMNFQEMTNNKIKFDCEKRILNVGELLFKRGDKTIRLVNGSDRIECTFAHQDCNGASSFCIYPQFIDFEPMSRNEVNNRTEEVLNSLTTFEKYSPFSGKYVFVSIDMNRCSENNTYSDKVYRRFYGFGNNFSPDESSENLEKWSNYKTGISIISPVQLRSNFLKIERIFNYYLLKDVDFNKKLTACPLCGGKNIRRNNSMDYTCYDCGHNISITYCSHCDPKHQRPIIWVKYFNDNFLKNDDVVRGLSEMSIYYRLSKIETIMGEMATTAFELEKEKTVWKLKTICPYCGIKLGDKKELYNKKHSENDVKNV